MAPYVRVTSSANIRHAEIAEAEARSVDLPAELFVFTDREENHMNGIFIFLLLLPLSVLAADQPEGGHWKKIDRKDIAIEDLAHSFFFHTDMVPERLAAIISEAGIDRIKPAIAEHGREMKDDRKIATRARRICAKLQAARNGADFARLLTRLEEEYESGQQQAARNILAKLDPDDRKALEDYLNTEFRRGSGRSRLDYAAMFAAGPFPSPQTTAMTKKACDGATKAEARVQS